MQSETSVLGALVPTLLLYFVAAVLLFFVLDWPISRLGVYRLFWHPPLARFALFVCLFSALSLFS